MLNKFLLMLLTTLSLPSHVQATEFKVDLIQLEPWAMHNPDPSSAAPFVGIIVELLDEFEHRSGHTSVRALTPYARVEAHLQQGVVDFSLMAWGDARASYANRGTLLQPLAFGVRALKGIELNSYADLSQITTSATRGLKIDPVFDADSSLKKDTVLNYTMGVEKTLLNRDSQAIAGSLSSINYIIKQRHAQDKFGDTLFLNNTFFSVAYSKKAKNIAAEAEVNAIFQTMVDDGTVSAIYNKWIN